MSHFVPCLLAAALAVGCATSKPGLVRSAGDNPLITIGAGELDIGDPGNAVGVWYVLDSATQTCWIRPAASGLTALDCCTLRRVEAARDRMPWATDATCSPTVQAPAPAPALAPPAPAPAVPATP